MTRQARSQGLTLSSSRCSSASLFVIFRTLVVAVTKLTEGIPHAFANLDSHDEDMVRMIKLVSPSSSSSWLAWQRGPHARPRSTDDAFANLCITARLVPTIDAEKDWFEDDRIE